MGRQIVKQPDGKYAIWSSVVDDFVVVDCENAAEIIDVMVEDSRRDIESNVLRVLAQLDRCENPYHQFTKTFSECLELIREIHGDDAESLSMMDMNQKQETNND